MMWYCIWLFLVHISPFLSACFVHQSDFRTPPRASVNLLYSAVGCTVCVGGENNCGCIVLWSVYSIWTIVGGEIAISPVWSLCTLILTENKEKPDVLNDEKIIEEILYIVLVLIPEIQQSGRGLKKCPRNSTFFQASSNTYCCRQRVYSRDRCSVRLELNANSSSGDHERLHQMSWQLISLFSLDQNAEPTDQPTLPLEWLKKLLNLTF